MTLKNRHGFPVDFVCADKFQQKNAEKDNSAQKQKGEE
jgi:hypothetical protein